MKHTDPAHAFLNLHLTRYAAINNSFASISIEPDYHIVVFMYKLTCQQLRIYSNNIPNKMGAWFKVMNIKHSRDWFCARESSSLSQIWSPNFNQLETRIRLFNTSVTRDFSRGAARAFPRPYWNLKYLKIKIAEVSPWTSAICQKKSRQNDPHTLWH